MTDDLISRHEAIDKMMDLYNEDVELYGVPIPEGFDGHRAVEAIKEIPPAEPERKHGEWIINSDGYYPYCSVCGQEPDGRVMTNFCPHCGADMRGKADDV